MNKADQNFQFHFSNSLKRFCSELEGKLEFFKISSFTGNWKLLNGKKKIKPQSKMLPVAAVDSLDSY